MISSIMKGLSSRSFVLFLILLVFVGCDSNSELQSDSNIDINKIKVAVFAGNGASKTCILETLEALKIDSGIDAEPITAWEIQQGLLDDFDVLILPGGSGSKELNNLGSEGKDIVRRFVLKEGKGIVGICAGSYLLNSTDNYPSLKLADAIHIDRYHYDRGRGLVEFELTSTGCDIFPEICDKKLFMQYYDGPVLAPIDSLDMKYNELGLFVSDIHPDDYAPKGVTPGKSFMINQEVGEGKIFLIVGHPESTPGMRWFVPRMARWVTSSNLISYSSKWVRPEINTKEIIFDKDLKKEEKKEFWNLFSDDIDIQMEAMTNLFNMRSRPAVRWNIGMLRDDSPFIRQLAAKYLLESECTDALPDLISSSSVEKDSAVKLSMDKAVKYLSTPN